MKPSQEFRLSEFCVPGGHLTREAQLETACGLPWIDPEGAARARAEVIRRIEEAEEGHEEGEGSSLLDCNWSKVTRRRKL